MPDVVHTSFNNFLYTCVCCNKPGFLKERSGLIIEMVKMAGGYQKGTSTVRITPLTVFKIG